jgi:hypothetical protein
VACKAVGEAGWWDMDGVVVPPRGSSDSGTFRAAPARLPAQLAPVSASRNGMQRAMLLLSMPSARLVFRESPSRDEVTPARLPVKWARSWTRNVPRAEDRW